MIRKGKLGHFASEERETREPVLCLRSRATLQTSPVYAGLLLFGLYFALRLLNLPFPIIFPINDLVFVFSFLLAFEKIAADDPRRHNLVECDRTTQAGKSTR